MKINTINGISWVGYINNNFFETFYVKVRSPVNGERDRLSRENGPDRRRDQASPRSDGSHSSSSIKKEVSQSDLLFGYTKHDVFCAI